MNEILIKYIQEHLLSSSDIELTSEDDLLGSGLVDSMGMVKLIAFIEQEFNLTVPPQDMVIENFMTISYIENYLEQRKQA